MADFLIIFSAKYLFLAIIIVAFSYFLKQPRTKQKQMIVFGVIYLSLTYIIAKIAGSFYYDPRPFVESGVAPMIPHAADNGFPSEHTLISAAISTMFYPFNKKISMLMWIIALIVGFSRVYAGIHHPIDILGSIVIAIATGIIVFQWIKKSKYYLNK